MSPAEFGSVSAGYLALGVSLIALYRTSYYFRGSSVALANNDGQQRAIISKYANVPVSLRDSVGIIDDAEMLCAIARLVWLNTGDRASYVHLSSLRVSAKGSGTCHPYFAYSYTDVAPGGAVFQPVLIYRLDKDETELRIDVEYSWYSVTRRGTKLRQQTGSIFVDLVDDHGRTVGERGRFSPAPTSRTEVPSA